MGLRPEWLTVRGWLVDERIADDDADHWDDRGRLSKLKLRLGPYWMLLVAAGIFAASIAIYLGGFVPVLKQDIIVLLVGIVLSIIVATYAVAYDRGVRVLSDLELLASYMGDSAEFFVGQRETRNGEQVLVPLASIEFGGRKRFVQLRDWFRRPEIESHKNKHHRFTDDGDGHLAIEIPQTAVKVSKPELPFGAIWVDHSGEMRDDLHSKNRDVEWTIPETIDARDSADVGATMAGLHRDVNFNRGELNKALDRLEEVRYRDDDAFEREKEKILSIFDALSIQMNSGRGRGDGVNLDDVDESAAENAEDRLDK